MLKDSSTLVYGEQNRWIRMTEGSTRSSAESRSELTQVLGVNWNNVPYQAVEP